MSAMKALLALVLCVSQANAAQPATKQSCADTKKSVSDKILFVKFAVNKTKKTVVMVIGKHISSGFCK